MRFPDSGSGLTNYQPEQNVDNPLVTHTPHTEPQNTEPGPNNRPNTLEEWIIFYGGIAGLATGVLILLYQLCEKVRDW